MQPHDLPETFHPFKPELKKLGISQVRVAAYIGLPHQTLHRYLNGYQSMPEKIEQRIKTLIEKIERGENDGSN